MDVVIYPPATRSLDLLEPLANWALEAEVRSLELVWSRRGCDTLRAQLVPQRFAIDLDVPWRYAPVRWSSHVQVIVDGTAIWEGFVTELEWQRGRELVGFTAVGYDRIAHDVVDYAGTYGNLLPTVVGKTTPFLRVDGAPPVEDTTNGSFTVSDACEFLRRLATSDGLLVDVRAEVGGLLRVTAWDARPVMKLDTAPFVVPLDAVVTWPRVWTVPMRA